MLLSKAVEGFIIARSAGDYSERTLAIYQWALRLLMRFLGDVEVEGITPPALQKFMVWVQTEYAPTRPDSDQRPLSPASVQNVWVGVRSFWNWATPELHIAERPDQTIKRPKFTYPEIVPFTDVEIKALLKACTYTAPSNGEKRKPYRTKRATADRDTAMILVLLDTGMRAGELCRLRVADARLEAGEVFIRPFGTGKKTKSHTVYIGKTAVRALWHYLASREVVPADPLFVTDAGRELTRHRVYELFQRMGKRAGVRECNPHRMRHTMSIQFLRNGGNVFALQKLLGHTTLEMTRIYVALADADAQTAHAKASPADRWHL